MSWKKKMSESRLMGFWGFTEILKPYFIIISCFHKIVLIHPNEGSDIISKSLQINRLSLQTYYEEIRVKNIPVFILINPFNHTNPGSDKLCQHHTTPGWPQGFATACFTQRKACRFNKEFFS